MTSRWRGAAAAIAIVATLLAVGVMLRPRGGDEAPAGAIESRAARGVPVNTAMQERIRDVARAASREEMERALGELRRLSSPDFSDLVPQLAIFLVDARDEREGLAPGVIADRLGVSREQIVRGVVPHLEAADPVLRRQLENLLGAAEESDGGIDFAAYRAVLVEQRGSLPAALVAHLYRRSPAAAVAILAATQGGGSPGGGATQGAGPPGSPGGGALAATAAEDVARVERARAAAAAGGLAGGARAEAAAALDRLSRHPDWWVRGYAAAVAGGDLAEVAGPALRERLTADPDPRVRLAGAAAD